MRQCPAIGNLPARLRKSRGNRRREDPLRQPLQRDKCAAQLRTERAHTLITGPRPTTLLRPNMHDLGGKIDVAPAQPDGFANPATGLRKEMERWSIVGPCRR